MYYVYIIQSLRDGSYYIGVTRDIPMRIQRHNDGWSRSTKGKAPWILVYSEAYTSKSEALHRERALKRMKSRRYIERLIADAGGRPDTASRSACARQIGWCSTRLAAS